MTQLTTPIVDDAERDRILSFLPNEFTRLSHREQQVSMAIYRLLIFGAPVTYTQLAEVLNVSEDDIKEVVNQWTAVYFDDQNRIIGYWGLALKEMPNRLRVGDQSLYAWCAWDSLFIPQLIDKTTTVYSRCAVSGNDIKLLISPIGIESVSPSSAVMSFIAVERAQLADDIINQFCHYVLFFETAEIGSPWVAQHPAAFLMTIEDGFALGQRKNQRQYPSVVYQID